TRRIQRLASVQNEGGLCRSKPLPYLDALFGLPHQIQCLSMEVEMPSKTFVFCAAFELAFGLLLFHAAAQDAAGPATLFNNVRIFDGKSPALSAPSNVLIGGRVVERISGQPIAVDRNADTRIINGGGRTLMPGLSDAHWHTMLVRLTPAQ